MTQLELARKGIISPQMSLVAGHEGIEVELIRQGVAEGTIVIPASTGHTNLVPCGIGQGLKTKVNATGNQIFVICISWNYYRSPSHTLPNKLSFHPLMLRHRFHLWRDNTFYCQFQLSHICLQK